MDYVTGVYALIDQFDRLRAALQNLRTVPQLRITADLPQVAQAIHQIAEETKANAEWVKGVARAFAEVSGTVTIDPQPQQVQFYHGYGTGAVVSTDGTITDRVSKDVVQDDQTAAYDLADSVRRANRKDDPAEVQALIAQLAQHQNDSVFVTAFFNELGPDDTYTLFEHIHDWNSAMPWNPHYQGDKNKDVLRPLDEAFALAERGLSGDFLKKFTGQSGGSRPSVVLVDVIRWGSHDRRLLEPVCDQLMFGSDGSVGDGTRRDFVLTSLEALKNNSYAAATYLSGHANAYGSIYDGARDRFQQLMVLLAEVDPPEGGDGRGLADFAAVMTSASADAYDWRSVTLMMFEDLGRMRLSVPMGADGWDSAYVATSSQVRGAVAQIISTNVYLFAGIQTKPPGPDDQPLLEGDPFLAQGEGDSIDIGRQVLGLAMGSSDAAKVIDAVNKYGATTEPPWNPPDVVKLQEWIATQANLQGLLFGSIARLVGIDADAKRRTANLVTNGLSLVSSVVGGGWSSTAGKIVSTGGGAGSSIGSLFGGMDFDYQALSLDEAQKDMWLHQLQANFDAMVKRQGITNPNDIYNLSNAFKAQFLAQAVPSLPRQ